MNVDRSEACGGGMSGLPTKKELRAEGSGGRRSSSALALSARFVSREAEKMMKVAAISAAPREACGLLVRKGPSGTLSYVASSNASPGYLDYVIDPAVQYAWLGKIEAVFHSHVSRDAVPSGIDGGTALEGMVYVIYSIVDDEFRTWRRKEHVWEEMKFRGVWGVVS